MAKDRQQFIDDYANRAIANGMHPSLAWAEANNMADRALALGHIVGSELEMRAAQDRAQAFLPAPSTRTESVPEWAWRLSTAPARALYAPFVSSANRNEESAPAAMQRMIDAGYRPFLADYDDQQRRDLQRGREYARTAVAPDTGVRFVYSPTEPPLRINPGDDLVTRVGAPHVIQRPAQPPPTWMVKQRLNRPDPLDPYKQLTLQPIMAPEDEDLLIRHMGLTDPAP